MAVLSWGTLKSLLIFFGPLLLPKAIGYYRSVRNGPKRHSVAIRPLPYKASLALAALIGVSLVFFAKALPIFAPENIFRVTQSRLQAPVDVLFTRLAAMRPDGVLGPIDTALRAKFVNLESRLLYLRFGPDVLASCPFCAADEPTSYLYYALPALLAPHLANLALIAAATSPLIAGREASSWRRAAALTAAVAAAVDAYLATSYNHQANARALRLADVDAFFWTARARRNAALGLIDALLAWLVYLTATNRAFVRPPSAAERAEAAVRSLGAARSRLHAVGVVRNAGSRDAGLRARVAGYWAREASVMGEVMEDREVIEGVNDALENRIDIATISRDAEAYARSVVVQPVRQTPVAGSEEG
ncbi:hypothetical protein QBC33DRAFT_583423 [Phialemonium atrogriseum]|uniref:Chorismate synthase protein n=1 Tax=Phialemonium atrogriseum TaxID=1093897 RepID=A0AAJ0C9A1_9PEZI|nr:uncharacterized protein QBC33DRAFT_583423 [Phialemonium atrogriseum]KAK1772538.1 hypothetical protein QBC33DRAFT_583423 [Phialemonium atrogriseum]